MVVGVGVVAISSKSLLGCIGCRSTIFSYCFFYFFFSGELCGVVCIDGEGSSAIGFMHVECWYVSTYSGVSKCTILVILNFLLLTCNGSQPEVIFNLSGLHASAGWWSGQPGGIQDHLQKGFG